MNFIKFSFSISNQPFKNRIKNVGKKVKKVINGEKGEKRQTNVKKGEKNEIDENVRKKVMSITRLDKEKF